MNSIIICLLFVIVEVTPKMGALKIGVQLNVTIKIPGITTYDDDEVKKLYDDDLKTGIYFDNVYLVRRIGAMYTFTISLDDVYNVEYIVMKQSSRHFTNTITNLQVVRRNSVLRNSRTEWCEINEKLKSAANVNKKRVIFRKKVRKVKHPIGYALQLDLYFSTRQSFEVLEFRVNISTSYYLMYIFIYTYIYIYIYIYKLMNEYSI